MLLIGVAYYNSAQVTPPATASVVSISQLQLTGVESINATGTTFSYQFMVTNHLPLSATVQNVVYNLYADGSYVGHGTIDESLKIPASASVMASTNLLLPLAGGIRGTWIYFLDGGNVTWRAIGNATLIQPILGILQVQFNCVSPSPYNSISCSYVAHGQGE